MFVAGGTCRAVLTMTVTHRARDIAVFSRWER